MIADLFLALTYVFIGFGLVCLIDTLLDIQDGPNVSMMTWFVIALAWPAVLLGIGVFVAWKMVPPE